jgi:hypothetical protein
MSDNLIRRAARDLANGSADILPSADAIRAGLATFELPEALNTPLDRSSPLWAEVVARARAVRQMTSPPRFVPPIGPSISELLQPLLAPPVAPAAGPPQRLAFDDDTHTVTLDGTPYEIADPQAYAVYKAIVGRDGCTITKAQIRARVKGVEGQKTISRLIKTLPLALQQTVKRSTKGYWHEFSK